MVVHELKSLFFTYFLAKCVATLPLFTLLGGQEGTTIINTSQPPSPRVKHRATLQSNTRQTRAQG